MEVHPHPEGLHLLRVTAPEYEATFEVYGTCPVQALGTERPRPGAVRHGPTHPILVDDAT